VLRCASSRDWMRFGAGEAILGRSEEVEGFR
jgi:hypothetical protein